MPKNLLEYSLHYSKLNRVRLIKRLIPGILEVPFQGSVQDPKHIGQIFALQFHGSAKGEDLRENPFV